MDALTVEEWFGHGYKNLPPAPGDFLELPSGGTYMGDLACSRSQSKMRNPTWNNPLPEFACQVRIPFSYHPTIELINRPKGNCT